MSHGPSNSFGSSTGTTDRLSRIQDNFVADLRADTEAAFKEAESPTSSRIRVYTVTPNVLSQGNNAEVVTVVGTGFDAQGRGYASTHHGTMDQVVMTAIESGSVANLIRIRLVDTGVQNQALTCLLAITHPVTRIKTYVIQLALSNNAAKTITTTHAQLVTKINADTNTKGAFYAKIGPLTNGGSLMKATATTHPDDDALPMTGGAGPSGFLLEVNGDAQTIDASTYTDTPDDTTLKFKNNGGGLGVTNGEFVLLEIKLGGQHYSIHVGTSA